MVRQDYVGSEQLMQCNLCVEYNIWKFGGVTETFLEDLNTSDGC